MQKARLPRILGAIFYDTMIVLALIFVAAQWFPLIPEGIKSLPAVILFKQVYIIAISFLYFTFSWRRGGQTIGMKSWRLKLVQDNYITQAISYKQAANRYLLAIISWIVFGLGFIWLLFSKQRRSWHDIGSNTHLIVLPKP